jgi:ADP-glucose pyrophosphorylase
MKKIRMVSFNNGEIAFRKYIDFDKNIIKERNEENKEVMTFNLKGIIESFGSIEKYIDYNIRVWNFSLLDSIN